MPARNQPDFRKPVQIDGVVGQGLLRWRSSVSDHIDEHGSGTDPHADSGHRIESMFGSLPSHGLELGTELSLGQDDEAEVFVQRSVPWNVGERGQCDGWPASLDRPGSYCFEQLPAEALALGVRTDTDLFHVRVAIDDIDKDVPDRAARFVNGDPAASVACVCPQQFLGGRFIVYNRRHSNGPKRCSCQAFDLSERWSFVWIGRADSAHSDILSCSTGISYVRARSLNKNGGRLPGRSAYGTAHGCVP